MPIPEGAQPELPLKVKLDIFEGPLDLLLHLIKKNEIDIYNIPITTITQQYLDYLEMMKSLNLDVAGEFLLMAATLLHIKSKMLLPASAAEDGQEETEEEEDPRAELVRRLLAYQQFKEAAQELQKGSLLDREVFARHFFEEQFLEGVEEAPIGEVSLFDLLEAVKKVLQGVPPEEFQEVSLEHLKIKDRVIQIMEHLWEAETLAFSDLFLAGSPRREIILSFLALLELLRLRMVRIYQTEPFGVIRIYSPIDEENGRKQIAERIQ